MERWTKTCHQWVRIKVIWSWWWITFKVHLLFLVRIPGIQPENRDRININAKQVVAIMSTKDCHVESLLTINHPLLPHFSVSIHSLIMLFTHWLEADAGVATGDRIEPSQSCHHGVLPSLKRWLLKWRLDLLLSKTYVCPALPRA
jgi:hypothetical protein